MRASLWLGVALLGCTSTAPNAVVQLRTDYVPGLEFASTRVDVIRPDDSIAASVVSRATSSERYLDGVRVASFTGLPDGAYRVEVEVVSTSGDRVGRNRVLAELRGNIAVTVLIQRSCAEVSCEGNDALSQCLDGRCVDRRCSPESLSFCPAPSCETAADCPAGGLASCTRELCEIGRCFTVADDSLCAGRCDPARGCVDTVGDAGSAGDARVDAGHDSGRGLDAGPALPGPIASLHLSWYSSCGIDDEGAVFCWGSSAFGAIGDGSDAVGSVFPPVPVSNLRGATEIDSGEAHSCARFADGSLRCWGFNGDGRVGDGTTETRLTPTAVVGIADARSVSVGDRHACALLDGGTVACWGDNSRQQLGNGPGGALSTPAVVSTVDDAVELAVGDWFTCVRRSDNTVWCWGENLNGQLGDGNSPSERGVPGAVSGLTDAAAIAAGDDHACALRSNELWCWGQTYGDVPVRIDLPAIPSQVSTGQSTTCAIAGLRVYCWGSNGNGQVGDGTTDSVAAPFEVPIGTVRSMETERRRTCAITSAGSLLCWGWNRHRQVADIEDENVLVPTGVTHFP